MRMVGVESLHMDCPGTLVERPRCQIVTLLSVKCGEVTKAHRNIGKRYEYRRIEFMQVSFNI